MGEGSSQSARSRWWKAPELVRSLPLFLLAAVFFVAGGVIRFVYPTYALYGPGVFTFWALLLALGFTSCIGGVVSWTLAGDASPVSIGAPTRSGSPTYLPIEFPEPRVPAEEPEPRHPGRARSEFGRPTPDIRPVAAEEDWYERPTDSERFAGPEYVLPIVAPPPVEPTRQERLEPVEKVLADLEQIERELAPRARTTEPLST